MKYHLGLGSNMGDRQENLLRCHAALKNIGVEVMRYSSVYQTQPVGSLDQPWYLNQVVEVASKLEPIDLLRIVKKIEKDMGRDMSLQPDKPRPIDIDILLAENCVINIENLQIPHPGLEKRRFVLVPLNEIAPDVLHPVLKLEIKNLLKNTQDRSLVKLYK